MEALERLLESVVNKEPIVIALFVIAVMAVTGYLFVSKLREKKRNGHDTVVKMLLAEVKKLEEEVEAREEEDRKLTERLIRLEGMVEHELRALKEGLAGRGALVMSISELTTNLARLEQAFMDHDAWERDRIETRELLMMKRRKGEVTR